MRLFLFIFLCTAHCNGQMGGGIQVKDNKEWPYVVKCGGCTGVIIHKHYVLTAGHCVMDEDRTPDGGFVAVEKMTIAAGDRYLTLDQELLNLHKSKTRKIKESDEVIPHPNYTYTEKSPDPKYDLALLYFKEALFEDGDEHIKSVQMVAAGERYNVAMDGNVGYQHKRTWQPAYSDSYHLQDDYEYYTDGRLYPVYTSWIPYDHWVYHDKSGTAHWVEYNPPAGSRCWIIGLGVQDQKYDGLDDKGQIKWKIKPNTNIKTMDEVEIWAYDDCEIAYDSYGHDHKHDHNRNFCFGRGLRRGGTAFGGDSGGPVVCLNPGEKEYKLHGIISMGDLGVATTTAVRLVHPELNKWVNDEMKKPRK